MALGTDNLQHTAEGLVDSHPIVVGEVENIRTVNFYKAHYKAFDDRSCTVEELELVLGQIEDCHTEGQEHLQSTTGVDGMALRHTAAVHHTGYFEVENYCNRKDYNVYAELEMVRSAGGQSADVENVFGWMVHFGMAHG